MRSFRQDAIIPLICAIFVLSGLAQARAVAGKAEQADAISHIALCLQSAQQGSDLPPPEHECEECRLNAVQILAPLPPFAPHSVAPSERAFLVKVADNAIPSGMMRLPWSTGPPNGV